MHRGRSRESVSDLKKSEQRAMYYFFGHKWGEKTIKSCTMDVWL